MSVALVGPGGPGIDPFRCDCIVSIDIFPRFKRKLPLLFYRPISSRFDIQGGKSSASRTNLGGLRRLSKQHTVVIGVFKINHSDSNRKISSQRSRSDISAYDMPYDLSKIVASLGLTTRYNDETTWERRLIITRFVADNRFI